MKVLASIVIVVLLLCGGALWFLAGGSLNEFVKQQIETVGSQVTEQKVTVQAVDIKLSQGAGSILGVNLANPAQYKQKNAFSLGEITLDINLKSLSKEPIIIDALIIKNPKVYAELTSTGGSNFKDLLNAIEKNAPISKGESNTDKPKSNQEPLLSVRKIILEGTELTVDLSALGNSAHTVTIPAINLDQVGGEQGLPASQLGAAIVKQALTKLWQQTKKVQKDKLMNKAKESLKEKAQKKLTDLFK